MLLGLDRLPSLTDDVRMLQASRVGLLAHPASVNRNFLHIHRVLADLDIHVRRIFGPEHGYGGEAQDMIGVTDAVDPICGAPIVSLYGDHFEDLSPRPEHLEDLDVLVVDLCDVGSRYYTFVWTALLAVRAAKRVGVRVLLLDRPNPIDGSVSRLEGRFQESGFLSFVGLEPIAVRHGLTVGEVVAEMAEREGIEVGPGRALDVVAVRGWDRERDATGWDRAFVMPSPNMPTVDTATVYPGGCLLEGTNLSEGRGTTRPFEIFGAPWLDGVRLAKDLEQLDLGGFVPRPLTFQPTFHKYAGQVCGGLQIHVTDRERFRPMAAYVAVIALAAYHAPDSFRFRTERYEFVDHIPAIDLLAGSACLRRGIESGQDPRQIIEDLCTVGERETSLHQRAVQRIAALDSARC
jgi:uncharacterized protein YbbC (DUF1343 family)